MGCAANLMAPGFGNFFTSISHRISSPSRLNSTGQRTHSMYRIPLPGSVGLSTFTHTTQSLTASLQEIDPFTFFRSSPLLSQIGSVYGGSGSTVSRFFSHVKATTIKKAEVRGSSINFFIMWNLIQGNRL